MMNDDLKKLAENLLKYGRQKGADQMQVSINNGNEFSVDILNGKIEKLSEAGNKSLSFKVIVDNKVAHASSTDLSGNTLNNLVNNALKRAILSGTDNFAGLPDEVEEYTNPDKLNIYDEKIIAISP